MRTPLALALALALAPLAAASDGHGDDGEPTDGVAFPDAPDVRAALEEVAASISGQAVHDCVAEVTGDVPTRYRLMSTPTHDAFLDAYRDVFGELGLLTALHAFDAGGVGVGPAKSPVQGGTNIVGVLPGRNATKWVVMGGHYDTRETTFGGGALDNASGFCTVLEIARAFKAYADAHGPLEATVVFLWYDGEEWGLHGAVAFAEDTSVAKGLLGLAPDAPVDVLVSQSFDMPGLNYPAKNTWVRFGDAANTDETAVLNLRTAPTHADEEWTCWSYGCYEELKTRDDFPAILERNTRYQYLVREVVYDLLAWPRDHVWVYDDHYGRSDHIPLIAKGAPGMRIQGSHDEEYPHYHQPTDTLDALYVLAGGRQALVDAYTAEAQAGGLTAFHVALTGDYGAYAPTSGEGVSLEGDALTPDPAAVPALGLLGVVAAALVALRRP